MKLKQKEKELNIVSVNSKEVFHSMLDRHKSKNNAATEIYWSTT